MRRRLAPAALAALCAGALLAGCSGSDDDPQPPPPPESPPQTQTRTNVENPPTGPRTVGFQVFAEDLQRLARTVQGLGGSLTRAAQSTATLREEAATFGLLHDQVESILNRMRGYRVDVGLLEGQRSRLVDSGTALSDSLERAEELAREGDVAAFRELLPQVLASLQLTFGSLAG